MSASSKYVGRAVVGIALSSGLLFGASVAQAEDKPKVPDYQVVEAFDAPGIYDLSVTTAADRERGMKLISDDLRDEDLVPEDGTLLVEFYDDEDVKESTGFAFVFDSEEAVIDAGKSERFGEVYDEDEAEEIMSEQDGIRVVSYRDFAEENATLWGKIKSFLV